MNPNSYLVLVLVFDKNRNFSVCFGVSDSVSLYLADSTIDSISNTVFDFSSSSNLTASNFQYYDGLSNPSFSLGFPYTINQIDTATVDENFSTYDNLFALSEIGNEKEIRGIKLI